MLTGVLVTVVKAYIPSFARAKFSIRLFHNENATLRPRLGTAVWMLPISRDLTARLLSVARSTTSSNVRSRQSVVTQTLRLEATPPADYSPGTSKPDWDWSPLVGATTSLDPLQPFFKDPSPRLRKQLEVFNSIVFICYLGKISHVQIRTSRQRVQWQS